MIDTIIVVMMISCLWQQLATNLCPEYGVERCILRMENVSRKPDIYTDNPNIVITVLGSVMATVMKPT